MKRNSPRSTRRPQLDRRGDYLVPGPKRQFWTGNYPWRTSSNALTYLNHSNAIEPDDAVYLGVETFEPGTT